MEIVFREILDKSVEGTHKTCRLMKGELDDEDILAIGDRYFELKNKDTEQGKKKYEVVVQDDKGNTLQTIPVKCKEHETEIGMTCRTCAYCDVKTEVCLGRKWAPHVDLDDLCDGYKSNQITAEDDKEVLGAVRTLQRYCVARQKSRVSCGKGETLCPIFSLCIRKFLGHPNTWEYAGND